MNHELKSISVTTRTTMNKRRRKSKSCSTGNDSQQKVEQKHQHMHNNNHEHKFKKDIDESTWSIITRTPSAAKGITTSTTANKSKSCHVNNNQKNQKTTTYSSFRKHRPDNYSNNHTNISSLPLPLLIYQRESSLFWGGNGVYCSMTTLNKFKIERISKGEKDCLNSITITKKINNRKKKKMMKTENYHNGYNKHCFYNPRSQWKQYIQRSLKFDELDTPISDAVLGLDRSGSFLIAVGDGKRTMRLSGKCPLSSNSDIISSSVLEGINYDCHNVYYDIDGSHPLLSLRFYAVPSVAMLNLQKRHPRQNNIITPHLYSIPLAIDSTGRHDRDADSSISTSISVTNTRIQILLSSDGCIGVAFVHHTTGDDASSSIVLFNTPNYNCLHNPVKIYKCSSIRIGGGSCHTRLRNLLWPTIMMPILDSNLTLNQSSLHQEDKLNHVHNICSFYRYTTCGYILFNDEDDGYRMFWIESESKEYYDKDYVQVNNISSIHQKKMLKVRPERDDIVEICSGSAFEENNVDPNTGYTLQNEKVSPISSNKSEFVNVVFEAYLHVDALLSDIIHRRRKQLFISTSDFHSISLPDYFYNIVSFNSSTGRSLTLVITFANPVQSSPKWNRPHLNKEKTRNAASYAILVEIDLFDQSYQECEWLAHPSLSNLAYLREWSNTLAIRFRMAEVQVGPFSVNENLIAQLKGCNLGVSDCDDRDDEYYFEYEDDTDADLWEPFVLERIESNKISVSGPKTISMSSLYRFCDVLSNDAVIKRQPVSQMKSKDFPLEIVY